MRALDRFIFGITGMICLLTSMVGLAEEIAAVLIHPPFKQIYSCSEHAAGQLPELGDALGTDCLIEEFVEEDGRLWTRPYRSSGRENADWFGWQADVLSPCDCLVDEVYLNPTINTPGIMGKGRAASVTFRRADGTMIVIAHIADAKVKQGDKVSAGQPVARVDNNGYSRSPHVHIGAWRDKQPLQIRFDQRHMATD
jgi:hypothetical protein